MRKALYLAASAAILLLTGCPIGGGSGPSLPATTSGGGFFISTGYVSEDPPLITFAPNTTISATWKSDQPGAAGDASPWVVTTDDTGNGVVPNGRVPATWSATWSASLSFPECDGYSATLTPGFQNVVEEVNCYQIAVETESSSFTVNPNPIYLIEPPANTSIAGSGFTSTYGMPVVQYFSLQGTLLAQATATSVSSNGTVISAPTPSLSGLSPDTYAGIINNIGPNGAYVYAGAASIVIEEEPQTATPYATVSVTLGGYPPQPISFTLTMGDSTPGATIYYTIYSGGVASGSGTISAGGTLVVPASGSPSITMYAIAPGNFSQSQSVNMSL